jgi:hypothetical protein
VACAIARASSKEMATRRSAAALETAVGPSSRSISGSREQMRTSGRLFSRQPDEAV